MSQRFNPGLSAGDAELLLERTFLQVVLPLRVKRVGIPPDFDMPPDFGFARIHEAQPNGLAVRGLLFRLARKRPSSLAQGWEAVLLDPVARFLGVSASGPTPECPPDFMVHPVERLLGRTVPMIVGPATNDRVQQANQHCLADGLVRINNSTDFLQKRVRVLFRRFHQRLAVIFAEVLSEEVKPLVNMGDACLVGGERQPSFLQEPLHQGANFTFQQLLRVAGDDEVVRIANEIDLGRPDFAGFPLLPWEVFGQQRFQSVQRQVRQRGRDDAALRRARLRGEQGSIFDVTGFQPFLEHKLVHGDMFEHPIMADVVEAAFDVAFQHPLRRTAPAQRVKTLLERVGSGAFRSEAVGIGIGGGLRDGFQCQQIQCLHGAVFHRGDAQRSLLSIGFRDQDAAQGQRPVTTTLQRPDGRESGCRSCPAYAIHSRRSPALIIRHPFHGQGFAGKRAGQQPLQSFHLAPAAFPCRLYDTCLQPPDLAFTLGPVHLIPVRRLARGRTHG